MDASLKGLSILGSTGSIGKNTLDVVRQNAGRFRIVGLSAGENVEEMVSQICEFHPSVVSMGSLQAANRLNAALRESKAPQPEIGHGDEGIVAVASAGGADILVTGITGAAGLVPTYHAVRAGKRIALANKETLVVAGELIMQMARQHGASILPVDSEHGALHQCLAGHPIENVSHLILTASGGPFFQMPRERFASVGPADALCHPTWKMGRKITIDSATLMNKGLEVIEAMHLFGFHPDRVRILIHPQSVVHSMVEMVDGSVLAHLGITDMRAAILYALAFPERWASDLPKLDLARAGRLEFFEPDFERFRCPLLAYQAARLGGTAPAILNAANEVAVDQFLNNQLHFLQIPEVIERTLDAVPSQSAGSLETYLEADRAGRKVAAEMAAALI